MELLSERCFFLNSDKCRNAFSLNVCYNFPMIPIKLFLSLGIQFYQLCLSNNIAM